MDEIDPKWSFARGERPVAAVRGSAAEVGERDDQAHRPRCAISERANQPGPENTAAVVDRADERRHGTGSLREEVQRPGDRVGHNEVR